MRRRSRQGNGMELMGLRPVNTLHLILALQSEAKIKREPVEVRSTMWRVGAGEGDSE